MDWLSLYRKIVPWARRRIARKALFAFNTNYDYVREVSQGKLPRLPKELAAQLRESMRTGRQREIRIGARTALVLGALGGWRRQIGGQAGNCATAAKALGVEVLLHRPSRALPPHYVFEFVRSPAEMDRLIATYDPQNSEMRADARFVANATKRIRSFSHALVSGFHLLDVHLARNRITGVAELLMKWKRLNPRLWIHTEFGEFQSLRVLELVLTHILPLVDSVGMNGQEALAAGRALGVRGDRYAVCERLSRITGEVVLHENSWSFALSKLRPADELRRSLVFANLLAAHRIKTGKRANFDELARYAGGRLFLCSDGVVELGKFEERKFGMHAAFAPALIEKAKSTVGVGDTFAAGYFLTARK